MDIDILTRLLVALKDIENFREEYDSNREALMSRSYAVESFVENSFIICDVFKKHLTSLVGNI